MNESILDKTIDGNKLIANFMGILTDGDRTSKHFGSKLLQYHSSWDWLMPVVEKIVNTDVSEGFIVIAGEPSLFTIKIGRSIQTVWEATIQFIQWYNQNK